MVSYTVTVLNECVDATLTIDPDFSIFKDPIIEFSATYEIMQNPVTIQWDSSTDIMADVANCGVIIEELSDYTYSFPIPLNPNIFTYD